MKRSATEGSVLILSLWTLMFLSALALAVGAHVSAGIRMASDLQDETVAAAAARGAMERSLDILMSDTNTWDSFDEAWAGGSGGPEDSWPGPGRGSVTGLRRAGDGASITNGGLVDEESRVNLNRADEPLLAALFLVAGGLGRQDADALARRTVEWRTAETRHDGLTADSGGAYDRGSGKVYAGGAPFSCVEEWRLVKGVDDRVYAACAPHLTVWGNGKLNVNTAGETVWVTLGRRWGGDPSVAASLARTLVRYREAGGVFDSASAPDMARKLGEAVELTSSESTLLRMMARSAQCRSSFYGGTAEGRARESAPVRFRMAFVVSKEKGQWVDGYEY